MAVCAGCGRSQGVTVLDAGVVLRDGPARRVVIERVTVCPPPPNGCGTQRVQRETRTLDDLGVSGKRYAASALKRTGG